MSLTRTLPVIKGTLVGGTTGALRGVFGAGAKKIFPNTLGAQQPDTANIILALAIGGTIAGLVKGMIAGLSPTHKKDKKKHAQSSGYTWANVAKLTAILGVIRFFPQLTHGMTEEKQSNILDDVGNNLATLFALNVAVSFAENLASSMVGHAVLRATGYAAFSWQQMAVDASIATIPSIVPNRFY